MNPAVIPVILRLLDLAAIFYAGMQQSKAQRAVTNSRLDAIYALKAKFQAGTITLEQLSQEIKAIDDAAMADLSASFDALPKPTYPKQL